MVVLRLPSSGRLPEAQPYSNIAIRQYSNMTIQQYNNTTSPLDQPFTLSRYFSFTKSYAGFTHCRKKK